MKYKLNCSKHNLDNIHETNSMKSTDVFWKNQNNQQGKNMKYVQDCIFKELE